MPDRAESLRYPENQSPLRVTLPERYRRFAELREDYLLGYGKNTARAYWGDLEHLFDWAEERGKDVLALSEAEFKQYCALLRRRGYSENTVRRRGTAWRGISRTQFVEKSNSLAARPTTKQHVRQR